MEERDLDILATKLVQKMMEPQNREALAQAIARALHLHQLDYRTGLAQLGDKLDQELH